jgi:hypothetical protein
MTKLEQAAVKDSLTAQSPDHFADAGKVILTTEQAQQIEEALEYARNVCAGSNWSTDDTDEALVAIRAARAQEQAEQELGAWHHPKCDGQCIACLIEKAVEDAYGTQGRDYMLRHINAAPVRTKDLTDEEILPDGYSVVTAYDGLLEFARAVIAADRKKNK